MEDGKETLKHLAPVMTLTSRTDPHGKVSRVPYSEGSIEGPSFFPLDTMSKKAVKVPKTAGSANIYDHRDVVLGKVRCFPLWPRMVRALNIVQGVWC